MNTIVKYITQDGDKATWNITISNDTDVTCFDVEVALTIPTGVSLTGPFVPATTDLIVPKGAFNFSLLTWFAGDLAPGESATVPFEFTVDDITQANPLDGRFQIDAEISSSCVEDESDNLIHLILQLGIPCAPTNLSIGTQDECDQIVNVSIG